MAFVYIVECADKTLYTGSTVDLSSRIEKHNAKKGAKYTRGRTPVKLMFVYEVASFSLACKFEYQIKKLTHSQKMQLINAYQLKDLQATKTLLLNLVGLN